MSSRTLIPSRRSELGQFFTPQQVAVFMAAFAIGKSPSVLFDPAVGAGAFQEAALDIGFKRTLTGCEIDPRLQRYTGTTVSPTIKFMGSDYFQLEQHNVPAMIANPPYLRFQHWPNHIPVLEHLRASTGCQLSGHTGSAAAFLVKMVSELAPHGRAAVLMPLEFLNTGYGVPIKRWLLEKTENLTFIRISDETSVFPDAITSVGILLLEKVADKPVQQIRFITLLGLDDLPVGIEKLPKGSVVATNKLDPTQKWQTHFEVRREKYPENWIPLSRYGQFSRGIATGANSFFVATPSRCQKLHLPDSVQTPCLTRSQQVGCGWLDEAGFQSFRQKDEAIILLDLSAAENNRSVQHYLDSREAVSASQRYLCQHRKPWYRQEQREVPTILFGTFYRERCKIIRNQSSAVALACFHGFNPKHETKDYSDQLWLFLVSTLGHHSLQRERRAYGNGLNKLEPGDLNKVLVPPPETLSRIPRELLRRAETVMLNSNTLPHALDDTVCKLLRSQQA